LSKRSNRSDQSRGDNNCRDKSFHDVNLQNLFFIRFRTCGP
jgi:hypothetical protein